MSAEQKTYIVKNRSAGIVVYRIPEDNLRREFMPGETKKITFEELEKLTFQPGGRSLMQQYLIIQGEEALEELNIHREPEYYMNEENIVKLIKEGSLNEFLDCLDFAPTGVLDLLQQFAISIPLQDFNKRQALKEKTGFDVDAALRNLVAEKENEAFTGTKQERRVQPEQKTPGRRTEGSKYKVVSKGESAE